MRMNYLSIVLTLVSIASFETDMAEQMEIDSVPHAGEAPTTIATATANAPVSYW